MLQNVMRNHVVSIMFKAICALALVLSMTPIVSFAQAQDQDNVVNKPVVSTNLVYNGQEQKALEMLPESDAYATHGDLSATNVGTYSFTATLKEGLTWEDGTNDPVEVVWSIAPATLVATYSGETIAQGATPALAVQVDGFVGEETPANTSGYVAPVVHLPEDATPETLEVGQYELIPCGGSADNYEFAYSAGTLVVEEPPTSQLAAGTYTVSANVYIPGEENPILVGLQPYFTNPDNPIGIGGHNGVPTTPMTHNATMVVDPQGVATVSIPVLNPVFTLAKATDGTDVHVKHVEMTGVVDKTGKPTDRSRIAQLVVTLDNMNGTYVLGADCRQYVTLFEMDMSATTKLNVDFLTAHKTSDASDPHVLYPVDPDTGGDVAPDEKPQPDVDPDVNPDETPDAETNPDTTPAPEPEVTPEPETNTNKAGGVFAQGTYTVSANIWLSKEDTGLPLNPHFTNGSFPPMDPVAKNATMRVDAQGRATVTVPIVIQKKIMDVTSITGLPIVDYSMNGSGLSSVTVDLGVLDSATSVVTYGCTANVYIGDLAMTIGGPIFGGERNHTYPATFQMNITGVPMSGGGEIPQNVLSIMNGQDPEADKEQQTTEAAEKALNDIKEPAKPAKTPSTTLSKTTDHDPDQPQQNNVVMWVGIAFGVCAVAAGVGLTIYRRTKR